MKKRNMLWVYIIFFAALLAVFYFAIFREHNFTDSKLAVINPIIPEFSFINQDGKIFSKKNTLDKVYLAEYFFTSCKGICPKMNANMRRVFEKFKNEKDFLIVSHTCMPETDSVPVLKTYERKMLTGTLLRNDDGSYKISNANQETAPINKETNWQFVTGNKSDLYRLARQGYKIDNGKPDSSQRMEDQFIHTQFFALVDRYGRVRAIYDGLKEDEIQKLFTDIPGLLREKVDHTRFISGFSNSPN